MQKSVSFPGILFRQEVYILSSIFSLYYSACYIKNILGQSYLLKFSSSLNLLLIPGVSGQIKSHEYYILTCWWETDKLLQFFDTNFKFLLTLHIHQPSSWHSKVSFVQSLSFHRNAKTLDSTHCAPKRSLLSGKMVANYYQQIYSLLITINSV